MKLARNDFFTGLFVIGGLLLGITTVMVIVAYNTLADRVEYILRMDRLGGVKKGTPIRIKNYTVGEVAEVIPIYSRDIYFKARIYINKSLVLYRGTRANITNQNVLGDPVIDLIPAFSGRYVLRENDTIIATNVTNLDEIINQLARTIGSIGQLADIFGDLAVESRQDLRSLLANLNSSLARINRLIDISQEELLEIMRNVRRTSATLDQFAKDLADNPWKVLERRGQTKSKSALP
ncbi:MAG: MlaD family protein [Leptospiraceae bacterium]|nr:MlaD family protein [Leptospiraceae bacterium]MDW8307163.1 MlaD family protein [Leptospiraceae bacterium]